MQTKRFSDGFRLDLTTRPYSRLVDTFYQEYAKAFVLPDERESLSGFRTCLALNEAPGKALHARFGPSREHVAVLRDSTGTVVAGMNFICFPMPQFGNVVTVHSMYVFVTALWRGRGLLRRIYQIMEDVSGDYAHESGLETGTIFIFVGEQNDPFRMTLNTFRTDTEASGLNQFDRMAIWGRLGARVLQFRYVQPALSPGRSPDHTLFLRVLLRDEAFKPCRTALRPFDPRVLKEHLRRFFGITVLKGHYDLDQLPEVGMQMADLDAHIGAGRSIAAHEMPPPTVLSEWKKLAAEVLRRDHTGDAPLGTLLSIASVPEAIACSAACHAVTRTG